MSTEREELANLIPLGFTERDPYRNVLEAADAILAWMRERGYRKQEPVSEAEVKAAYERYNEVRDETWLEAMRATLEAFVAARAVTNGDKQ